ncbi:hypothetical protein ACFYSC_17315 [Streptosporangium sp. NPDC004379]|uniref:hypothetical protein n=1 Tax=Streptosporangium sp. NPDC004379 TaxID=3366189 RepID=UPI0036BD5883
MRITARPHQLPARVAAGLVILESGLSMAAANDERARQTHGMAAGTYPFLKDLDPQEFTRWLARSEIALGAALLLPVVPSVLAGAALAAFAGGLMGLYLRTPGLRRQGSLRPTPEGLGIVKDVWLLGIGTSLVAEELRES